MSQLKPFFMEPYFNIRHWAARGCAAFTGRTSLPIIPARAGRSRRILWVFSACEGLTLPQMIEKYGADLIGTEVHGAFPLLIKLIDAREWLSVQVHPNDGTRSAWRATLWQDPRRGGARLRNPARS